MKKSYVHVVMLCLCVAALSYVLVSCGGGSGSSYTSSSTGATSVQGVAAGGAAIDGTVTLKDSSLPPRVLTSPTNAVGAYRFNTRGLKPPFLLKVVWTTNGTNEQMYSFTTDHGTSNVNPFSHAVVAADAEDDPANVDANTNPSATFQTMAGRHKSVKDRLKAKLAQLFALYGVTKDPCDDDFEADHTGLDALFDDIRIAVANGTVTVTNKATGGVIFTAPINNLDAGTFNPGNMPGAPNGATLYASACSSCHGPLATSDKLGATAARIQAGISSNDGGMGSLSSLTAVQIQAIASALTTTTPPPAACTYTYDAWGACQPNNTQTRNVLSSTPAGCTGTPVTSQACIYVPPVTTCTSFTYSTWGACQSNNTQTRTVTGSSPAGCTGGTPVLSQACTYVPPVTTCTSFTYSTWAACQSNNTQSRTVTSSSPAGCTGGTPVLSQACTYMPPVTTCTSFTYSAWGVCQSNNTQTRTVATSSPAGCTGGTPVLSQACTYVPPTTCGTCHSIPPSTGQHSFHSFTTCATCHGSGYSSTTVNSATHANGVNNVVSNLNYANGTCATPGCHGSRSW